MLALFVREGRDHCFVVLLNFHRKVVFLALQPRCGALRPHFSECWLLTSFERQLDSLALGRTHFQSCLRLAANSLAVREDEGVIFMYGLDLAQLMHLMMVVLITLV